MSGDGKLATEPESGGGLPDPDLIALPEPRRPFRRLTLLALATTALASLALLYVLVPQFQFALSGGTPQDLGELGSFTPQESDNNTWVRADANLTQEGLGYRRPLDGDAFRAAPVVGNSKLWVEVRVPGELDSTRFIPPSSFVGRLVRLNAGDRQYSALQKSIGQRSKDPWILIDGQSPSSTRWVIGLGVMLLGFFTFAVVACVNILKPPRFYKSDSV